VVAVNQGFQYWWWGVWQWRFTFDQQQLSKRREEYYRAGMSLDEYDWTQLHIDYLDAVRDS